MASQLSDNFVKAPWAGRQAEAGRSEKPEAEVVPVRGGRFFLPKGAVNYMVNQSR